MNSWRTTRPRLAPSDSLMPISRWRALARASITFETLAQAASRTSTNAANTGDSTIIISSVSGAGVACGRSSARTGPGAPGCLGHEGAERVPGLGWQ